jgi:phosphosulfolactate synthase
MSPLDTDRLLRRAAEYLDIWKFGWGTGYFDPDITAKVDVLQRRAVLACIGGTLLEAAWVQGRVDGYFAWAADIGVRCVEVSNGVVQMPLLEKRRLIERSARTFVVVAEVGSKNPAITPNPQDWVDEMLGDVEAGATWVITEGRETGTVGLYNADGSIREDIAEAVAAAVDLGRVIFEAPQKDQRAWLITRFGAHTNLGNIATGDVFAVEALRAGLRGDTMALLARPMASQPEIVGGGPGE